MIFRLNLLFLLLLTCSAATAGESTPREITRQQLEDKIAGLWLGQLTGNYFGFPFELLYIEEPVPVDVDRFYTQRNNGSLRINNDGYAIDLAKFYAAMVAAAFFE